MPIEVVLDMQTELRAIDFRVGDAKYDSLRDHAERKLSTPEAWMLELRVSSPPSAPTPDASAYIARLRAWHAANPLRPIVGLDWERLDIEKAIDRIRATTAAGEEPKLEETWLERGPAMRVL